MTTVVLATRNEHKVHELRQILGDLCAELGLTIVGADDFPEVPEVAETEVTFIGNARLKAVALAAATGLPAVADDSGLTVEVLGGSPGVFSARWSGTHAGVDAGRAQRDAANLRLLLEQVADVPDEHRGAAFVEYVILLCLVVVGGSTALYSLGLPLVRMARFSQFVLGLPIP